MSKVIVCQLKDDVKPRLKRRVEHHGRTALKDENEYSPGLGSRIAARFNKVGLAADLPELHGQSVRFSSRIRRS